MSEPGVLFVYYFKYFIKSALQSIEDIPHPEFKSFFYLPNKFLYCDTDRLSNLSFQPHLYLSAYLQN